MKNFTKLAGQLFLASGLVSGITINAVGLYVSATWLYYIIP